MLDEDKIRLMARLSIYEENKTGKEDLKMNQYYHIDYVLKKIRQTIIGVTIAFFLLLFLVGAYFAEDIMLHIDKLDYKEFGIGLLAAYLGILAAYIVTTIVMVQLQSKEAKKRMGVYRRDFRLLRKYYKRLEDRE